MYLSAVSGCSAASIDASVGVTIGAGMSPGCVYVWKPSSSSGSTMSFMAIPSGTFQKV